MKWSVCFCVCALLIVTSPAAAHPTVENGLDVIIHPDRVELSAKITLEQIDIASSLASDGGELDAKELAAAIDAHGQYLLSHFKLTADGVELSGRVAKVTPPLEPITWRNIERHSATYQLTFALPTAQPNRLVIEHDMLKEFQRLGQSWVAIFATQIKQAGDEPFTQLLLTREEPIQFECHWSAATPKPHATSVSRTAYQYTVHGLHHILTGYDHLLFVAALVLGSAHLWDLVKVVTAFALAHTLTLTLSVLDIVRLPSSIVEPIIAASIVCVALQNVFFPRQARGGARLAIAFGFGLFHGLGFAGGLLEAMEGMPAISLAIALIAFTVGVELAHQVLIVPLSLLLRPMRRGGRQTDGDETETVLPPPMALRLTSLLISVAGLYYFVAAIR